MSDEEIIEYCLERLEGIPYYERTAYFRSVVALAPPQEPVKLFSGSLKGIIQEKAANFRVTGFPFNTLFFIPEWNLLLGELEKVDRQERYTKYLTHRDQALFKALPDIKKYLYKL